MGITFNSTVDLFILGLSFSIWVILYMSLLNYMSNECKSCVTIKHYKSFLLCNLKFLLINDRKSDF
jgi:hypothetical protein